MKKKFFVFKILFPATFTFLFGLPAYSQNTFTSHLNIEYANIDGFSLRPDIYTPDGQTAPTPLIIWIHGGGWQDGNRSLAPNGVQLRQARRGYAVASLSYRLSGRAKFPAQIHDEKNGHSLASFKCHNL
ncbi:MAG: alpha/beta hydrolase [Pyrinomonadaceae bacterium]